MKHVRIVFKMFWTATSHEQTWSYCISLPWHRSVALSWRPSTWKNIYLISVFGTWEQRLYVTEALQHDTDCTESRGQTPKKHHKTWLCLYLICKYKKFLNKEYIDCKIIPITYCSDCFIYYKLFSTDIIVYKNHTEICKI